MDVCPTIAWLLGVRYPEACRARVLVEALESEADVPVDEPLRAVHA
jgi:hypothetical protein